MTFNFWGQFYENPTVGSGSYRLLLIILISKTESNSFKNCCELACVKEIYQAKPFLFYYLRSVINQSNNYRNQTVIAMKPGLFL